MPWGRVRTLLAKVKSVELTHDKEHKPND